MSAEVFRFVTIRPPQQMDALEATDNMVDLGLAKSALTDALRKLRGSATRAAMLRVVDDFIASPDFIDSPRKLNKRLLGFAAVVQRLPDQDFWSGAQQAFTNTFAEAPSDFVASEAFTKPYVQLSDSIVVAMIENSVSPGVRALLVRVARALWLIRRLADKEPLARSTYFSAPLILPDGIFPLPAARGDLKEQRKAQTEANQESLDARRKRLAQLAADLASLHQAKDDLLSTFEKSSAKPAASTAKRRTAGGEHTNAPAGFLLSDAAVSSLSDSTRATLRKIGVAAGQIDVGRHVTLLEKQAAGIASQLYGDGATSGIMVRIGNMFIPQGALSDGHVVIDPGPNSLRSPGPCPPAVDTTAPDDSVTVPTGHGDARILGVADLMVLEQELLRYQLGEIAHIENVLKSEERSREFKTTDTTEQTLTTETEITAEKSQDLSSTERFELQTESQTVINNSASKEAGLTIHASYGPSVDATANYGASSSTSTQQSNAASTNYAREITTKAVERLQTRTLTRRTVTTMHVVEETNRHGFSNKMGSSDIVGIYRFVDKIYRAQIVNYGKRLMLEFIVPEPAAFLRYALTNKPVDNVSLVNPEPPGYCLADGTTFMPLQAADITRDTYLYWASKYGAQDVTPPPPSVAVASGSKKAPDQMQTVGDRNISSDTFDIAIADGYLCQRAFVNLYGETQAGKHQIVFQLQEQQGVYIEPWDDQQPYELHLQPTPTLTVTLNSIGFHNYEALVTVFCTLSIEKFQDWQLKTFNSIMSAYHDLKSAYDEAVQEARLQMTNTTISGTNPENNRITEQTELKKGCISLLTGQRFELFDAVARNVAPYGYPEIDFAEAKAEGEYIQFFEQSFEWSNMVYLFYPYFWGKKDDWVTVAQLTDDDPLFGQFLRAGAARVQVPVRQGFEDAIITYLSTGELWAGEGTVVNTDGSDPGHPYLSVIDELKSQTGNFNVEGVGTISVTTNSATVSGSGTAFTMQDENRRIVIAGGTYVIKTVQDAQTITLTGPYPGASDQGLGYALGGKLVGQPWEVKLPTNLIKLDSSLVIS